ncbi:hypothetical protein OSTOST_24982 [Ostertagia ostertagi]
MSNVNASKANLTKAVADWEIAKGKIPASILQPVDVQNSGSLQMLEARQATIKVYLAQVRVALTTLSESRQAFLSVVKDSSVPDEENDAHTTRAQETRVDAAITAAESIMSSLSARYNEVKALIDTNQRSLLSDTLSCGSTRSQEQTREVTPTVSTASDNVRTFVLPQRSSDPSCAPPYYTPYHPVGPVGPSSSILPAHSVIQLGKLTLEPFTGDITKFHRFWSAFELAVHNDPNTPPAYKFLYLQGLLQGEAPGSTAGS